MDTNYPQLHERLQELAGTPGHDIPDTMGSFAGLRENAVADGVLSNKTKELVALGIAIAVRCDGSIAYDVHDALEADAARNEITEIIGVAVLMGGGPAPMYGAEAYEALDQFEAAA